MRLIKKYGNRRLYDTTASAYITLEQLARRVRDGDDVKIVHAKSGEDLTQPTLTQIILDSRGAAKLLPVPLLVQLIRLGDDALAEFFGTYVTWALDVYLRLRRGAGAMASLNPFAPMLFPTPFTSFRDRGARARGREREREREEAAPTNRSASAEDVADEVAELRRELEDLKRELGKRRRTST